MWVTKTIENNWDSHRCVLYSKWISQALAWHKFSVFVYESMCTWKETVRAFSYNERGPINKEGYTSVIKCQNDYRVSRRLAYSSWTRRVELSSQTSSINKRILSFDKFVSQHGRRFFFAFVVCEYACKRFHLYIYIYIVNDHAFTLNAFRHFVSCLFEIIKSSRHSFQSGPRHCVAFAL